jgi:chemotaxis protein MotB
VLIEKKHKCPAQGAPAYMLTYGDLVTQLLVFFTLLIAISNVEPQKVQEVSQSVQAHFRLENPVQTHQVPSSKHHTFRQRIEELAQTKPDMSTYVAGEQAAPDGTTPLVRTVRQGDWIVVGVQSAFERGRAQLNKKARDLLREQASMLKGFRNKIIVKGHAALEEFEDSAVQARFGDAWELAFARSRAVQRYLCEELPESERIEPWRIALESVAQYEPVIRLPHLLGSDQQRQENRRFELVVTEQQVHYPDDGVGGN